jgi:hypothetical protein
VGYDRVYTRRMTRKRTQELQKVKIEPKTETHDRSIENPTMKKKTIIIKVNILSGTLIDPKIDLRIS